MGLAWNDALDFLERKPRSKGELVAYLERKGYAEEEIKEACQRLEELNYLDDYKFAQEWVEERLRFKPMGRFRLEKELEKHFINSEIINSVLDELLTEDKEKEIALNLLKAKANKQDNITEKKAAAFLYRRGFEPAIIFDVLYKMGLKE